MGDALGVEAGLGVHGVGLVLVLEDVGQGQGADLQAAVQRAVLGQGLQHEGAEAADRAFFHRDQRLVLAGQPQQHVVVQRLGEAGVGDGGREAARGQHGRRPSAHSPQARAERQDGDRRAFADDAALADLQRRGQRRASARPMPSPRG